jgi:hypothetical protein
MTFEALLLSRSPNLTVGVNRVLKVYLIVFYLSSKMPLFLVIKFLKLVRNTTLHIVGDKAFPRAKSKPDSTGLLV